MTVHFICRGNVLRSLIAETYLKSLEIPDLSVLSSGTGVDKFCETDTPNLLKTLSVLKGHGLAKYAKSKPDQLTQQRINDDDITVVLNDRVFSDASELVRLPANTIIWSVTDIGEGTRTGTLEDGRELEEVIFDEVVAKVDQLVRELV
jgi:protein-tyrosine-phosphatase